MINKTTLILLLCVLSLSVKAQNYLLDIKKSKILWKIETVGKHNGYILFSSGKLNYSGKGQPTTAYFTINMNGMRSMDRPTAKGREKIDIELRSPGFFDVNIHPTATMDVKQILPTPTPLIYRVRGNLTIKGITNPIEFTAAIVKKGEVITVKSNLTIARAKWKIDLQEKPKDHDFFATIKDKMMPEDIMITLDLTFHK
ncbi:YceI family protein [Pedobacter polaris]|uniref:YceI family protein n=1 Tax=Pedobacter polaris TaxID=2571273 RepID=A0A4U1CQN0_9SPHI|nr:YceI family protein [Pedobacter polaris]TKC09953.1 YceI family protein [Pedobacter polaris]